MGPRKQAKVAFHLSLWPFVLFVSLIGVLYILIIVAVVSPASSAGKTVLESIVIFIILAVKSPAMAAPRLSSLIGVLLSIRITGGVDRRAMKNASRAAIFGFASIAVYAFLLFSTAGIGR
ncbi:MAG: hypothetical protein ACE5IJ_10210 [Thermoplasmata archaeon]